MKGSKQEEEPCQFYYLDSARITSPDTRIALPLRRFLWRLRRHLQYLRVLGPFKFTEKMLSPRMWVKHTSENNKGGATTNVEAEALNLQPGELVEIRSEKEVFNTLDREGKLRGLRFNPEMRKYCGKRFKVYKRLEKIILESTGELRTVRTPTVLLEGVYCDGEAHGGCDRSCFCFWREAWLKRVEPQSLQEKNKEGI